MQRYVQGRRGRFTAEALGQKSYWCIHTVGQAKSYTYDMVRWLFLRGLGLIYLCAFASLLPQIQGLIGHEGILPAGGFLEAVAQAAGTLKVMSCPTLAWLSASDASLQLLALAGTAAAVALTAGLAPRASAFAAWLLYLSLVNVGGDFLAFQWDILLLETGFAAIFVAPAGLGEYPIKLPERLQCRQAPNMVTIWLLRVILFKLMLSSGAVKLLSGDPNWANFHALMFHYWTQPLPTPIAWWAAKLPPLVQQLSVAGTFFAELVVPFLIFFGRWGRIAAFGFLVLLQLLIAVTGNYAFFNLLTVVLCISLLDDQMLRKLVPQNVVLGLTAKDAGSSRKPIWLSVVALALIALNAVQLGETIFRAMPPIAFDVISLIYPFRISNSYGLFAVMTTERPEVQIEGSDDGQKWLPYEFKYKVGDLRRAPPLVAPHQPRLDWQMWFAALGNYRRYPWFLHFVRRLLEGSKPVLELLQHNPFPDHPPKLIRATLWDYRFSSPGEKAKTGNWWVKEYNRLYLPPVSLKDSTQ